MKIPPLKNMKTLQVVLILFNIIVISVIARYSYIFIHGIYVGNISQIASEMDHDDYFMIAGIITYSIFGAISEFFQRLDDYFTVDNHKKDIE